MFNKASFCASFLLGTICLIVAAALVRGFCLSVLWGWLIVPVFGLPKLTIAAALGVALVINYFLRTTKEGGNILNVFAEGAVVLGLGYLFHLFI
jgi:hypothetical protein